MKILLTGSDNPDSLASLYFEGLSKLNVTVIKTFYNQKVNLSLNTLHGKIINKLSKNLFYRTANKTLLQDVELHKPDVLILFKGMEIFPATLDKIKAHNLYLVNYNADHPLKYIGSGSGNKFVKNSLSLFDLHLTYSKEIQKELIQFDSDLNVKYLPFGYSSRVLDFNFDCSEINRACFVGAADNQRASIIKFLSENGIEIDVYGPDWLKYFGSNEKNICVFNAVSGREYYETLYKYRVQLNLMRDHNYNSHNMRTFEAVGSGSLQLNPDTKEHRQFFDNFGNNFFYKDKYDLLKKILYFLALDISEVKKIRQEIVKTRNIHTYDERSKQLLSILSNQLFLK